MPSGNARLFASTRIAPRGIKLRWPMRVALRGEQLLVVEGRDLLVVLTGITSESPTPRSVMPLGWRPGRIELSPSGRHALVFAGKENYLEVWDLEARKRLLDIGAPDTVVAAAVAFGADDLLLVSRRPGQLEVIRLPSLERLESVKVAGVAPFVFESIVGLEDGDTLAVVGHWFLDPVDRLAVVSLQMLVSSAPAVQSTIEKPAATGHRLAVGPCGWEQMVVYADAPGSAPGISVRVPGQAQALETLHCHGGLTARTAIIGSEGGVAIARHDTLDLIERRTGASESVRARAVGLDGLMGRAILVCPDGGLELVMLPNERAPQRATGPRKAAGGTEQGG